jgi:phage terminase large subunit-like protein
MRRVYDSPTRTFVLSMGRKNGKTAFAAMLLLLHLCGPEAKPNSSLYSAAQSRDQAAILFALAAKMVRMDADFAAAITIRDTIKELACAELGTLYKALSADASTKYGLSPAFVVHDELGQVRGPRSELYDALETASAAQSDPLSIVISTQAPTDADLLSLIIDDAKSGADPRIKLEIYAAPPKADPFSEEAIRAANPHFDVLMNKQEVMRQAADAKRMPSQEARYRNLILNQRISQTSPFIPRPTWDACAGEIDERAFAEGEVFLGLDLSARNDLTALAMAAKLDGVWHVKVEFFAPALGMEDRAARDRAPYDVWRDQGYITAVGGASVDYAAIAVRLCEVCDDYQVAMIAYDRWRIDVLKAELARVGRELPLMEFGQGFRDMSPALDALEGELLNGKLLHGGNPVLTWCAANAVATRDPAGNRKLDKSKATGRIDGMVAMTMAIGAAAKFTASGGPSVYEERGVLAF